jgi:hypothetical protein
MLLRHRLSKALTVLAFAGSLGAFAACAPDRVYVQVGPPQPVMEVHEVSPGPGYVWIPGYHRWDGRAYVWTPGYWTRGPRSQATWSPGHWSHNRKGWFYITGHWR